MRGFIQFLRFFSLFALLAIGTQTCAMAPEDGGYYRGEWACSFARMPKKEMSGLQKVREIVNSQLESGFQKIGAFVEGQLVGLVKYRVSMRGDEKLCYICNLRVEKAYRNNGIGSELLHRAMEDIKQQQADTICLIPEPPAGISISIEDARERLKRFYERFGFKRGERWMIFTVVDNKPDGETNETY